MTGQYLLEFQRLVGYIERLPAAGSQRAETGEEKKCQIAGAHVPAARYTNVSVDVGIPRVLRAPRGERRKERAAATRGRSRFRLFRKKNKRRVALAREQKSAAGRRGSLKGGGTKGVVKRRRLVSAPLPSAALLTHKTEVIPLGIKRSKIAWPPDRVGNPS